ncbi:MAG: DUF2334 domain-containing protein [Dictyoglomus sp.]|nr:DUF2334 domain-containing protein [Dictyoglomus sp.]MCX7942379.1 DUF2334 domain-containing protein [Dictyoglomaceae bacterium]MDW8188541.1 DUF2334 domain-containing protein [Dictyoglomus sp.]
MIYKFLIILLVFILISSISFCEDKKKVLIIYDVLTRIGEDYSLGKLLEKYLSHYNVEVGSVSSDIISNVEKYDLIIYLGLEEKFLKKSFLKEISKARKIIWIEANIYDYVKYIGCKDFKGEGKQLGFTSLIYKNKEIPFEPENSVYIIKPQKGKILSYISDGINKYPWVFNIDNLYYFGRLDFRDNTGIIFLDLLHEILEVKHKNSKKAMIILDDISPLTSAEFLEEKLKTYCCQGVPYLLVVHPTIKKDGKIFYLWDNEKLLSLLRKVEESGGFIIQGSFYENDYNSRINNDLNLLASCELYPVAFKMYDIPYKEKRVDAGKYFKIILDDSLILTKDLYTLIYPVNLGKYNPRDPKNKIEVFKKAKEFLAFRDIIIGISIPSYVSSEDIEELISNLKDLGYDFLDFSQEPYQVANENLIITNKNGKKWVVSKISPYSKTAIEKFFDRFIAYLKIFLIVVIISFLLIIILLINNKRKLYERELKK